MRKLFSLGLIVIFLFCGNISGAIEYPQPAGYVNDLANIIEPDIEAALEAQLIAFEEKTTSELVVVTVPSLEGIAIEEYTMGLIESWKCVGKRKSNNGLVFLVAPNERKWRVEVGYGLEGVINDAKAGRIAREIAVPYFKDKKMGEGIRATISTLISELSHPSAVFDQETNEETSLDPKIILIIIIVVIVFVLIVFLVAASDGGYGGMSYSSGGY